MAGFPEKGDLSVLCGVLEKLNERAMITDPKGTILYVNPVFERLTGYSKSEVLGKNPRILQSGKHSQRFYKQFWEILLEGGAFHARFINKKKDGTLYSEIQIIVPFKDQHEQLTGFVSIAIDTKKPLEVADELAGLIKNTSKGLSNTQGDEDPQQVVRTVLEVLLKELEKAR